MQLVSEYRPKSTEIYVGLRFRQAGRVPKRHLRKRSLSASESYRGRKYVAPNSLTQLQQHDLVRFRKLLAAMLLTNLSPSRR